MHCETSTNLALHHLEHRAHGGSHDDWNVILLCDGHHKLLHEGVVTIEGRAPDALVFTRDGESLVDARSPAKLRDATSVPDAASLRDAESAVGASPVRDASWGEGASKCAASRGQGTSRFDDAVKLEHAKQALKQLGFKGRAAMKALEEVRAHVGTNAGVQTLVTKVLALESQRTVEDAEGEQGIEALARQALVQSGFPPSLARKAVASARAELARSIDLATLIREALQRCRG